MGSETTLSRVVNEVSCSLSKFAEDKGWKKSDYWIYYDINTDWDYVTFVFVSSHFDDTGERDNYKQVWSYLLDEFSENPEILRPVTLVAWGKGQVDRGGLHGIPSGFSEFWTVSPAAPIQAP